MAAIKKGDVFVCEPEEGCGIEVEIKKICGCIDECDLICCGKSMAQKGKSKGKSCKMPRCKSRSSKK